MHRRAVALLLALSAALCLGGVGPPVVQALPPTPAAALTVSLSATPSYGSAPLTVDFDTNVSSGTPTAYNWSFGDGAFYNGSASSAGRPSHVYANPGIFMASVTVREGSDLANASIPIHVVVGPLVVRVTATPTTGAVPLTVTFGGSASGGTASYVDFNWTFGDGGTGTGATVRWTYERPGNFYAVLSVEDTGADEADRGVWVNVSSAPTPSAPSGVTGLGSLGWGAVGFLVGLAVALFLFLGRAGFSARRTPVVPDGAAVGPPAAPAPPPSAVPSGPMSASAPRERAPTAPRPRAPAPGDALKLSQRIVLHLASQGNPGPYEVAPPGATQAGMIAALGVRQNALTNVLRRLEDGGVLAVEVRHVRGQPRRLKVYQLTPRGELLARELRHRPPRGPAE